MKKQRASAKLIAQREKEQRALELRKAGLTYDEIAKSLEMSKNGVWKAVNRVLEDVADEAKKEATGLRALEALRLDDLQKSLWARARKGDLAAMDRIIRVLERRAKLLGLDAPVKAALTDPEGAPVPLDARDSLFERLTRLAAGEAAAGGAGTDQGKSQPS